MRNINVSAYTGGKNDPSSRFRVRQLIPYLKNYGIYIDEFISPVNKYPPANRFLRPFWGAAILPMRIPQLIKGRFYDVTLLQRELVSTLYSLERLTCKPRVLDVDDAIFLHRDGQFIKKITKVSDLIICGNDYLADNFSNWHANVKVLPTSVDTNIFYPKPKTNITQPIIGWIGTSSNMRYLKKIEIPLARVLKLYPQVLLRIVTDRFPDLPLLPSNQIDFIPWTSGSEVDLINSFSIGIMPLSNGDWERGKCSFKMLQYMACAIPVIVSPVGMNIDVLRMGDIGLAAESDDDWISSIIMLLNTPIVAQKMGLAGREVVLKYFSTEIIAFELSKLLSSVA